jgi:hypothetical protein
METPLVRCGDGTREIGHAADRQRPPKEGTAPTARGATIRGDERAVVTVDEVRALAATLPRSSEAFVRGRIKFRVGQIVYLSLSPDSSIMGCGFPKEVREAAISTEPEKFSWPSHSDLRFNWIHVDLAALDAEEMRDLVEDAWALCVPKFLIEEYAESRGYRS